MSLALRFGPMPESELLHTLEVGPTWTDGHPCREEWRLFALLSLLRRRMRLSALNLGFSWGCIAPVQKRGPAPWPAFWVIRLLRWVLLLGNLVRIEIAAEHFGTNRLGSSIVVADEIHRLTETWMWLYPNQHPERNPNPNQLILQHWRVGRSKFYPVSPVTSRSPGYECCFLGDEIILPSYI